jgi:hypothetical protein
MLLTDASLCDTLRLIDRLVFKHGGQDFSQLPA